MLAGNIIRYLGFAVAIALAATIILMTSPKVPDCASNAESQKAECN